MENIIQIIEKRERNRERRKQEVIGDRRYYSSPISNSYFKKQSTSEQRNGRPPSPEVYGRYWENEDNFDDDGFDIAGYNVQPSKYQPPRHHTGNRRGRERSFFNVPKNLSFDGSRNWNAFKMKFNKYAESQRLSSFERRGALCFCLTDKASEFYTTILSRNESADYFELMDRLDKRYGQSYLSETARMQFQTAKQAVGEDASLRPTTASSSASHISFFLWLNGTT